MQETYGHDFYKDRHQKTSHSANAILSIVIDVLPEVHSAIDFGCGVGAWLSVLKEKGVDIIQGIDGPWVEKDLLEIPGDNFREVNFEEGVKVDQKYDLAISLEVAEHLRPEAAKGFVASLANASDFVLFSAAIPFQGGRNHINEQWPDYWAALFKDQGYVVLDFIRRAVWDDEMIQPWYRQNTLLFVRDGRVNDLDMQKMDRLVQHSPLSLVHPAIYLSEVSQISSVSGSFRLFRHAIKKVIKEKFSNAG